MGLFDLIKKPNDKEEEGKNKKEYLKNFDVLSSYTDPKTGGMQNSMVKDFIKNIIIKKDGQK